MWPTLIMLSAIAGSICGLVFRKYRSIICGAAIPWLGVLAWLLYNEYFLPYQGGGASMWPVAQLVAGSVAAVVGGLAAVITQGIKAKLRRSAR